MNIYVICEYSTPKLVRQIDNDVKMKEKSDDFHYQQITDPLEHIKNISRKMIEYLASG